MLKIQLIIITANSFIELVTYLFKESDAKSFLSERISQDPVEKLFGRQRQRGAVNENPTVNEFLNNNQALRIVDSTRIDASRGNTRGANTCEIINVSSSLLQKRKTPKHKETEKRCRNNQENPSITCIKGNLKKQ